MKRLILAFAALSFVFLATGCGQSGPLYIPGNPSKMAHPPAAAESTADQEGEEDGDQKNDKNGETDKQ